MRYFLIQRRADTEFVFDADLALSKSDENPVYYIQYAHARICSVINNAGMPAADVAAADASLLTAPSEFALMQRLAEFPHVVALPPRNWPRTTSPSGCATAPRTSTAGTTPSA
ncbi:DALR anticodon-binding domain-containing protein, partial [Klebsiella pneumoniae subsp. pneumoniae]